MFSQNLIRCLILLLSLPTLGCIGIGLPQVFQHKPYTMLRGGDQIGRDQLANRALVVQKIFPINGMVANEVLSILGQPQEIQTTPRTLSEDWYFAYYKQYKTRPKTDQGLFLVRFHDGKVVDVVKVS